MFRIFYLVVENRGLMKPHSTEIYTIIFVLFFAFASCVNLRHVAEFSGNSIEVIEQFETFSPSFEKTCAEDCRRYYVAQLKIHNVTCDCAADQKADSILQVMYQAVRGYLYGLREISNNELTVYGTDALAKTLVTGNYGPLKLDEEDVDAYTYISTLLIRTFTDGYRRKKVREYITHGNDPLQNLLKFLELNLSGNLLGKMEVQKSDIKNFYFDLVMDKDLSTYERTKFAEDYFLKIEEIETRQRKLSAYSEILYTIAEGHTMLHANVNKLTKDEIRTKLSQYSDQLLNMEKYFP